MMRLCRFDAGTGPRHGIAEDGYVVDRDASTERHRLEEVRLLAPVHPRKFMAIGLNYADHIAESGMEAPAYLVFFNKQVTCVSVPMTTCTCHASRTCSTTRASLRW
jgi:2-keto-4-pentenoate hydratase/2-oxohepta-3-ene-1,7-dioic acid hydratase in catechol pathway